MSSQTMTEKFEDLHSAILKELDDQWENDILSQLEKYIAIPNKSPMFDANWKVNGYMDAAMELIKSWCEQQTIKNMSIDLMEEEGLTPVLFLEIPGETDETVLIYGHMDKQPEMRGWDEDKGPWKPVRQDGKLYGRGGADDGYSIFSALSAIAALQRHGISHARIVILLEASEESGSVDLPFYVNHLKDRLGSPSLIFALDSTCGNYDQLWGTTSIRGLIGGTLSVRVAHQGTHSGMSGGLFPSCFDVMRELLNRIEDSETGEVIPDFMKMKIPPHRVEEANKAGEALGTALYDPFPRVEGLEPLSQDLGELVLKNTWYPTMDVVGINGYPKIANAGSVAIPSLKMKLSCRIPPLVDPKQAVLQLKALLEDNPPKGAEVTFEIGDVGPGWDAPPFADWLQKANEKASQQFFGKSCAYIGIGGSIPFMFMLGEMFPEAQFMITGVLGPKSNAHGPNEFLHIDYVKRLTGAIASIIASHFDQY